MPLYLQTDRRFVGLELKVGFFTVVSILAIVILTAIAVRRSDFFAPTETLYFFVKSGEGIKEGMPVKLSGFTIGRVRRLDLWDMAKEEKTHFSGLRGLAVKVNLEIKNRYFQWIPADSKAFLRKENVIGDQIVEIIPGALTDVKKGGDLIAFGREKQLNDYFADISEQVKMVRAHAERTMEYINDPEGEVRNMLGNLLKFTVGLVETREKITKAFGSMDQALLEVKSQVHSLGGGAGKSIESINQTIDTANTRIPQTFKKIDDSLDSATSALVEVKQLTGSLTRDLPELMETGKGVAKDAEELTGALKKTWPINRNIKPAQTKPLDVDSHENR